MDNVYQIAWVRFIDDLLLISLRKAVIRYWLRALIQPIRQLHQQFLTYRSHCLYRIKHNSQIAFMEAVLNDKFDSLFRRIRILNVEFKEAVYFYEPEENREVYFYEPEDEKPVYFYEDDDLSGDGVDFVVCVPPSLQPFTEAAENALLTRMRGQIDYYKLYSKNYKIVWEQVND